MSFSFKSFSETAFAESGGFVLVHVTGVNGTGVAGDESISTSVSVTGLSGFTGTASLGEESVTGTCTFAVTGVAGTTALGDETASASINIAISSTSPVNLGATTALGSEAVSGGSDVTATTNVGTATNVSHKWCLDDNGTPSGGTGPLDGFTNTSGNNSIYNTQVLPVGDQFIPQVDASSSKYLYRETSGTTSGRVSFLKSAATSFPSNGIIRMGVFVAGQTLPAGDIEALAVALVED